MIPRLPLVVVAALALVGCGGHAPTTPTPTIPNIAGNYAGTIQSSNYAAQSIQVTFTQSGGNATGTWTSSIDWSGSLTLTIDVSGHATGTATLDAPNTTGSGPRCFGTVSVGGSVTAGSVNVSGGDFAGSCLGMPTGVRFVVQRR